MTEEQQKTLEFLSKAMAECFEHSLPELSRPLSENLCGMLSELEVGEKRSFAASKNMTGVKADYTMVRVRNSSLVCQYCGSTLMPGINCNLRIISARNLRASSRQWNRLYRDYHGIADSLYNQRIRNLVNTHKGFDYFQSKKKETRMKNVFKVRCLVCKRTSLLFGTEKAAKAAKENSMSPARKVVAEEKPAQKVVKKVAVATKVQPQTKTQTKVQTKTQTKSSTTQKKVPEKDTKKKKKVNDGGLGNFLSGLKF